MVRSVVHATIIGRWRENSPKPDTITDIVITYPDTDSVLDRALDAGHGMPSEPVRQTLVLDRTWLETPDRLTREATYHFHPGPTGTRIVARLGEHEIPLDEPVRLTPVCIPKPWGREIWLTGIESRGESLVRTGAGELPLSQYLALAPRRLARNAPLVLLKILDPKPEPVIGDLYFEVHEEKREVYVVTHVDATAWPDGRGRIRFGMNQARRREYRDDDRFRDDYLAAVRAYEEVRRALDAGETVAPEREQDLRAAMESFTAMRELAVGDVVVVPTWLPHSLQHGVRVIEFQTPTYERYILSFAQRVLTQPHWDTAEAVPRMRLEAPPAPAFDEVTPGVENIVTFDDFRVWRARLAPGAELALPDHPSYVLCMVVQGEVNLGGLTLAAEEAAFVPAAALADGGRVSLRNPGGNDATVLLAAPDL